MRVLFFICSVAIHCLFLLLVITGSSQEHRELSPRIINAELICLAPEEHVEPEPTQEPEPQQPPSSEAPQPSTPQTDAAPKQQPDVPSAPAPLPPGTETIEPGQTAISTKATPEAVRPVVRRESTQEAGATRHEPLILRQGYHLQLDNGQEVTLKRGAEFRSLRMLAIREYTIDEYVGHYQIDDDHFVSIVDARDSHGTMIFIDPSTHLVRKLKKFGNMIYTYGPSYEEDQPVEGTITFLTSKENTEAVKAPSRILWDPAKPPALLATKIYFREKHMELETPDGMLGAELVAPQHDGPYPGVVLINGDSCAPPRLFRGLARQLALRGMAVLVPEVRGCGGTPTEGAAVSEEKLVSDARLWFSVFTKQPFVDGANTGYWGRDNGSGIALRAAVQTAEQPPFLFCSSTQKADVRQVAPLPERATVAYEGTLYWLFTGPSPAGYWSAFARALDKRPPQRTEIRYLKTENEDQDLALWLSDVGPDTVEDIWKLAEKARH